MREISDMHHTFAYEVVTSEPSLSVSSLNGIIRLKPVTFDNTVLIEWETEYSNDADANLIADQKYKKLENFKEMIEILKGQ